MIVRQRGYLGFEQDGLVECSCVGNDESNNFRRDRGMGRNVCMFHAVHTCTHKCTHAHMHKPAHTHTREPSSTKQLMCQPSRVQSVYTLWSSWLKIIGLHIAVVTQCLLCSLPNVCRLQRQLFSLKLVMRNQLHASHDQGCWSRHQGFGTPKKCQFGMKVDKK